LLNEILKKAYRLEMRVSFGILGLLMALSLKVIINLLSLVGELMRNGCLLMPVSIGKDARLPFI